MRLKWRWVEWAEVGRRRTYPVSQHGRHPVGQDAQRHEQLEGQEHGDGGRVMCVVCVVYPSLGGEPSLSGGRLRGSGDYCRCMLSFRLTA